MKIKTVLFSSLFILLFFLVSASYSASPYFFKGYVFVNGSLAPNGTIVQAFVNNASTAANNVVLGEGFLYNTRGGWYTISFEANSGNTVIFKVNGISPNIAPYTLVAGGIIIEDFNLSVSGTTPAEEEPTGEGNETTTPAEEEPTGEGNETTTPAEEEPTVGEEETPTAVCGNNVREGTEECDGTDMAGQTCQSKGFAGGTLKCTDCKFDTSACSAIAVTGAVVGDNATGIGRINIWGNYYFYAIIIIVLIIIIGGLYYKIYKIRKLKSLKNGKKKRVYHYKKK